MVCTYDGRQLPDNIIASPVEDPEGGVAARAGLLEAFKGSPEVHTLLRLH